MQAPYPAGGLHSAFPHHQGPHRQQEVVFVMLMLEKKIEDLPWGCSFAFTFSFLKLGVASEEFPFNTLRPLFLPLPHVAPAGGLNPTCCSTGSCPSTGCCRVTNVVSFSFLPFRDLVIVPADCQLCPGDLNEALALTGFC